MNIGKKLMHGVRYMGGSPTARCSGTIFNNFLRETIHSCSGELLIVCGEEWRESIDP